MMGKYRKQQRNVNRHTDQGTRLLDESVKRDGWIGAITTAADGETFDGSNRIQVGGEAFENAIEVHTHGEPVVVVRDDIPSADDPRAKRLGVAANAITAMDWNPDAALLKAIADVDPAIRALAQEDAKLRELLKGEAKRGETVDPTELVDKAAQLQEKWQVQRSDIWACGRHRLMCGDSTSKEDVERLMDGKRAQLVVTSPPYFNQRPEYANFETYEQYNAFLSEIVKRIIEISDEPFVLAWNTGDNQPDCLPMIADQTVLIHSLGLMYLDTIIWKKSGAVYSIPRSAHIRRGQYYYPALAWEPVVIFRRGDKMPRFEESDVDRVSEFGINVWEINQVVGSEQNKVGHPAMFPLELATRVMLAYSKRDCVVCEPFSGSGTTLVACEQTGRIGYGMEIEPKYCAVAIERLSLLGLNCERVESSTGD